MGALAATTPDLDGTVAAGAPVALTDTIARAIMGPKGCYLRIANGNASPDAMTISDASATPSGAAAAANAPSVTNSTAKIFHIKPDQVNPATGLVTITHSVTATVTYELYPVG